MTLTAEGAEQAAVRLPLRRDEVAGDVFATLQTPLLRGRTFSAADGPTAARVAIINEAMAQQVWGSRDPIGRRLTFNPSSPNPTWFTVVGVVGNMRRQGLEIEATPQMFEALAQNPSRRAILFVRTGGDDPRPLVPLLRAAVRGVDANAVIYGVTTADARLGALLAPRRLQTSLLAAFSLAALLLATLGIYGVIQYRSRRGPTRSASAWRSGRASATCSAWSCARGSSCRPRASCSGFGRTLADQARRGSSLRCDADGSADLRRGVVADGRGRGGGELAAGPPRHAHRADRRAAAAALVA